MRVAMVETVGAHGGMDYYDFALCRNLNKAGHDAKLYTSEAGPMASDNIEISEEFRGVYGSDPKPVRALRWVWALYRTMSDARRSRRDIMHFHFFGPNVLYLLGVWMAKLWKFRVVATVHDVESVFEKGTSGAPSMLFNWLDGIIVHNDTSRLELSKFLKDKLKRIMVIPHGHYVDYVGKQLDRNVARELIGLPKDCPLVLFFGQIRRVKGLDTAIKAIGVLKEKIPNVRLVVAGKVLKDDIGRYERLIDELGIKENVIMRIGYVPQSDVDAYYYGCDAVVLPYRKIYQSGVLLMAMSYGMPVIASDLPGMRELIKDGEDGILFPMDDPAGLARAILRITGDASLARSIGRKGKDFVRKHHDWNTIARMTAQFYRENLESLSERPESL